MWLKQSTAGQEVLLGPFLDDTDGKTAETGLTIANTDIKLWKDGATTEANKNSGGATHISGGRYYAVLDATDTNTLGKMEINVHVSGALPVRREFVVLPANAYDSLVSGTDTLQADMTQISGAAVSTSTAQIGVNAVQAAGTAWGSGAITAGSIASAALDGKGDWNVGKTGYALTQAFPTNFADLAITSTTGKVTVGTNDDKTGYALSTTPPTAAAIADAVWDELVADHTTPSTFGIKLDVSGKVAAASDVPTAVENRQEMDSNSTLLGAIVTDTGTTLPGLIGTPAVDLATDVAGVQTAVNAVPTAAEIWEAAAAIEGTYTPTEALNLILAACVGKLSGAASTTVTIRDILDARNAIVATVDADGNRSAITLDPS